MKTLWVMTDLPHVHYVHAWPEGPHLITLSAFSRRNLLAVFGFPLLSPSLIVEVYCDQQSQPNRTRGEKRALIKPL